MAHRADALIDDEVGREKRPVAPARSLLIALAVLELAWLAWFLNEPLPDAGKAIGRPIDRATLLLLAIPGARNGQSILGQAARNLSHVENLPQRLPIVLGAQDLSTFARGDFDMAAKVLTMCGTVICFQNTFLEDKQILADRVFGT